MNDDDFSFNRVDTERGDMYLNDDAIFEEISDKRAQYSNHLPPDFQVYLRNVSFYMRYLEYAI